MNEKKCSVVIYEHESPKTSPPTVEDIKIHRTELVRDGEVAYNAHYNKAGKVVGHSYVGTLDEDGNLCVPRIEGVYVANSTDGLKDFSYNKGEGWGKGPRVITRPRMLKGGEKIILRVWTMHITKNPTRCPINEMLSAFDIQEKLYHHFRNTEAYIKETCEDLADAGYLHKEFGGYPARDRYQPTKTGRLWIRADEGI